MSQPDEDDELMTPAEVAEKFRVDPKTVNRWAASKKLPTVRTPGGHLRFKRSVIKKMLEGGSEADD